MQTWKIKGQVYTLAQLRELKAQGLDPHKDKITMKFISKPAKNASKKPVVARKGKSDTVTHSDDLPSNFMQLKKLAGEKGMKITIDTKKDEILKYLKAV